MDVSKISAISPKQIDWRKLTAPEIIEYKEQGVEVPTQYLQWAQDFMNDVNSSGQDDDTTYEVAHSQSATGAQEAEADTSTEEVAEGETETSGEVAEEPKTAAQSKRENMQEAGVSLAGQAQSFIGDSRDARSAAFASAVLMASTADKSSDEIQALEFHMKVLLSKAEETQKELKNEVDSVNDGDNKAGAIGKINKLNDQLQKMGLQGQNVVAGVEGNLQSYESIINSQSEVILNAKDFGTETTDIGSDLLASIRGSILFNIRDFVIGHRAERTGEKAVKASEISQEVQTNTLSVNSENIATANNYKNEIQDKTGVAGVSPQNEDNQEGSATGDSAQAKTNSATETDKASSASLDQILQAKIRKGENVGNDQLA